MSPAALRIGTLEMTAALAAIALIGARSRSRSPLDRVAPVGIVLGISERGSHSRHSGLVPLDIGRASGLGLVLNDPQVSRLHARLEPRDGIIFLRDLDSSNGTFLNGSRVISPIEVRVGDEIDVGGTRLTVEDMSLWT